MLPISFKFVAAAAAQQLKGNLYRFSPSRTGQSPDWTQQNGSFPTEYPAVPITDKDYWLGRYVLCTLLLVKENGERLEINDAVVKLTRERNIVCTAMVGGKGTVKEFSNEGDWDLLITVGIVATRDGRIVDEYPIEGLAQLRQFLEEQAALEVYSEFLHIFDIDKIVVTKVELTQNTASNYQTLKIDAKSDNDYNVYSTEY